MIVGNLLYKATSPDSIYSFKKGKKKLPLHVKGLQNICLNPRCTPTRPQPDHLIQGPGSFFKPLTINDVLHSIQVDFFLLSYKMV